MICLASLNKNGVDVPYKKTECNHREIELHSNEIWCYMYADF